jgi:hypothetical protein
MAGKLTATEPAFDICTVLLPGTVLPAAGKALAPATGVGSPDSGPTMVEAGWFEHALASVKHHEPHPINIRNDLDTRLSCMLGRRHVQTAQTRTEPDASVS